MVLDACLSGLGYLLILLPPAAFCVAAVLILDRLVVVGKLSRARAFHIIAVMPIVVTAVFILGFMAAKYFSPLGGTLENVEMLREFLERN